jgi:hypothetical protein
MAKKDQQKDGDVRISKKFPKEVPVPLSDEEIRAKEHLIRQNLSTIANLEEDMKPFKDKRKAKVDENHQLRKECEDKKADQETHVFNEFHFKQNLVIVKVHETGAEVERRPMTEEERQEEFSDLLRPKAGESDETGDEPAN